MKKNLVVTILLCVLLCGCGMKLGEEVTTEVNKVDVVIEVDATSVTKTGCVYTMTNNTEGDFAYDGSYGIHMEKDGKWYRVDPKSASATTADLLWLPSGVSEEATLDWSASYGELKKGHYRLVKNFADFTDGYYIVGEFAIE